MVVAGEVGYARATDAELLNIAQKPLRDDAEKRGKIMLTYKAMFKYLNEGVHAEVLDFPGVITCGRDLEEARQLLASALVDILVARERPGLDNALGREDFDMPRSGKAERTQVVEVVESAVAVPAVHRQLDGESVADFADLHGLLLSMYSRLELPGENKKNHELQPERTGAHALNGFGWGHMDDFPCTS